MFERHHLERILKINGVSHTASDAEFAAVLEHAHYRPDEVASAIKVLRGGSPPPMMQQSMTDKIMRSDSHLSPQEVTQWLGVEMKVEGTLPTGHRPRDGSLVLKYMIIGFLSCALAVGGVVLAMNLLQFGIFHPTAALVPYGK